MLVTSSADFGVVVLMAGWPASARATPPPTRPSTVTAVRTTTDRRRLRRNCTKSLLCVRTVSGVQPTMRRASVPLLAGLLWVNVRTGRMGRERHRRRAGRQCPGRRGFRSPRVAAYDRFDISDQRDCHDIAEPLDKPEATENTEANDPTLPADVVPSAPIPRLVDTGETVNGAQSAHGR